MMQTLDREVLEHLSQWLAASQQPWLCTIVKTTGSSPRPVGSLVAISEDGLQVGSVSGGCVEEELLEKIRNGLYPGRIPQLLEYGVSAEENERLGLPCGGRLELLVEQLDSAAPLERLLERIKAGELVTRRVCLATGEVSLHAAAPADEFEYGSDYLAKVFGPRWQLLLIGDGHLARYVAQLALTLDYRVIICDPRHDYEPDEVMDGVERIYAMPDEAVKAYATHPRCAVVAVTHDPKLDDMALLDALKSPAFYVGALGSQRNSEQRRERLKTLGLTEQQLQRLHAPVGLPIGSHSPPEIAVSILAEITALRHQAGQGADSVA